MLPEPHRVESVKRAGLKRAGSKTENAMISLYGCYTAEGSNSIAQAFANHFNRMTLGIDGGLSFDLFSPRGKSLIIKPNN